MRRLFADYVLEEMKKDKKIWVVTGDLGYKLWDQVQTQFGDRFINTGSAEQLLVDLAIGLKLNGKIPIVYSIAPFLLYRPFESLRTYVNYEKIGIKLIGSGRDRDYTHDGFSHWAEDDENCLSSLNNIKIFKPKNKQELKDILPTVIYGEDPFYLNLQR